MGVKCVISLMKLLLILPCLLGGPSLVWSQSCCPTKIVSGMDVTDLDGTYSFFENRGENVDDPCIDGCVYTKTTGPADDEYCFKTEPTDGNVQCQDAGTVGTTPSVEDLQTQKSALENEVETLEAAKNEADDLNSGLDDVDAKVEELTAEGTTPVGRVQRQVPESCDDLADIIEELAIESKTNAERLVLVKRILSSNIQKCVSKTKLTKTKVKIKVVKTETGVRIKFIVTEKTKKEGEIIKKKKQIIIITLQIDDIVGDTAKPPNTTGQGAVEITLKPTGEIDVTLKPTGEQAVSVEPTGEQAVSIIPGGATNAPTGEIEVPMNSTGQQAVEIKPTGQQAVEIKPTGQQAVGSTNGGSNGQNPVAMEINPTGQQAVGITNGGSNGQNPVAMDGGATKQM